MNQKITFCPSQTFISFDYGDSALARSFENDSAQPLRLRLQPFAGQIPEEQSLYSSSCN